jgi:hypothetical protein
MTLREGAAAMTPPMPRRELARRLAGVDPVGTVAGRLGRRPKLYPVTAIMQAHAAWVKEQANRARTATAPAGRLANDQPACHNGPQVDAARKQHG